MVSSPNSFESSSSDDLAKRAEEITKDKLAILPALINSKGLLNHHIASFDHLVLVEMKKIILNEQNREIKSSIDPDFYVRYLDIRVAKPLQIEGMGVTKPVTPHECRLRDMTYCGDILVDIKYTERDGPKKVEMVKKNVRIGSIPIMLRSKTCNLSGKTKDQIVGMRECPLDPGGYFVIKGVEKVCLVQEQQSKNRIIIESDDHGNIVSHVQSKTHYSISKCAVIMKKGKIYLQHRSFIEDIPIVIVLKALGMESDQMIGQHIGSGRAAERILYPCFEQAMMLDVHTQSEALNFIGERRKDTLIIDDDASRKPIKKSKADEAADFLANVLLCHIREGEVKNDWNFRHKALYVSVMVRRMIEATNDRTLLDERDFYGNKRFETTGTLMGLLFEDLLKQFNRVVRTAADQHLSKKDSSKAIEMWQLLESKHHVIEKGMKYTLSSGNWDLKRFNMSREGVTQVLNRLSHIATVGMMTRLASSFEKTRKISGPRSLQPSQWGMVCPCDTPEGESCGLVKNFALLSQVTLDQDDTAVRSAAHNYGVEEVDSLGPHEYLEHFQVFLNGTLIGIHRQPNMLCVNMRNLRRSGRLHPHVSVYVQSRQRCVHLGCDGGRIVRLYIVVKNGVPLVTSEDLRLLKSGVKSIQDLMAEGCVEFIDVNEGNDCLIAAYPKDLTKDTTHYEIEPFSLLGVVAGIIPFPHKNQAARNTFQSAMGKQALGGIGYNQQIRVDTLLQVGVYPQRPLCRTKSMDVINYEKLGAGINAMVCVMSYSGYDIEDAQIYNRSSLDRGYARCVVLRKHEVPLENYTLLNTTAKDDVVQPPMDRTKRNERYHALDIDGIVTKGSKVNQGDVLVNRYTPSKVNAASPITYRPTPLVYKLAQSAVVDHVVRTAPNGEDGIPEKIKVITREVRVPEPGDKFSSRHGQKGVVGLITDSSNLPFNAQGIIPDMIMNPHGFPSRMTVGKLMELMSGKAGVIGGHYGNGTAFGGDKPEDVSAELVKHGYNYHGKDMFYSGITGEVMQGYVFFGPIYYQRLKHMVVDKMHARSTGPRSLLTRQPTEGRARSGGLRVGEMERDCMVGYGASMLLNERLLRSSDLFTADVCRSCGNLGYRNFCPYCQKKGTVSKVNMPYAFKLLLQEMMGMGIAARLVLDDFPIK